MHAHSTLVEVTSANICGIQGLTSRHSSTIVNATAAGTWLGQQTRPILMAIVIGDERPSEKEILCLTYRLVFSMKTSTSAAYQP